MKTPRRIIDKLRRMLPTEMPWRYDALAGCWRNRAGRAIRAYSASAPRHDNGDEHFVTEYRWEDTHERVALFPPFILKTLPPIAER